ncbi:MAG: hypothetical protein QOF74_6305 [Caballeronia mineralivorans]|nr:hypothetical protein [Caballeronia mineralivorans]
MRLTSKTALLRTAQFCPNISSALSDQVHQLDAAQNDARAGEVLEPRASNSSAFDGPMVLPDDVVQIFDLTNLDGRLALGVHRVKRGQIGVAFVDGHRLGRAVLTDCLFEEAPASSLVPLGPEQKIDGAARLMRGSVKILPRALDLDIGFINHPPALADRTLVLTKRLFEQRHQLDDPAMYRRMIDANVALSHHFLEIAKISASRPRTTARTAESLQADSAAASEPWQ